MAHCIYIFAHLILTRFSIFPENGRFVPKPLFEKEDFTNVLYCRL